jgi:putative toxin-antitoxin system antitoxin component (TIGR02293 family)
MTRNALNSVAKRHEIQRFQRLNLASLGERAAAIRQGVPAVELENLAALLGLPLPELSRALGVPPSTIRRKAKKREALPAVQGERVLGLQRIVGQVQTMVEECGDPKNFDVGVWTGNWLLSPQPALGEGSGMDFLGTVTGQQLLSDLLMRNVSGAYS